MCTSAQQHACRLLAGVAAHVGLCGMLTSVLDNRAQSIDQNHSVLLLSFMTKGENSFSGTVDVLQG